MNVQPECEETEGGEVIEADHQDGEEDGAEDCGEEAGCDQECRIERGSPVRFYTSLFFINLIIYSFYWF